MLVVMPSGLIFSLCAVQASWLKWFELKPQRVIFLIKARYVKTVNGRQGQKTVGVVEHRYRLRWDTGIYLRPANRGTLTEWRPASARIGALVCISGRCDCDSLICVLIDVRPDKSFEES